MTSNCFGRDLWVLDFATTWYQGNVMRAEVFIDQSEGGVAEISVVKHGLSSGAARKYRSVEEAMAVLLVFGFDRGLVDRQLAALSETSPHVLVRFPVTDISDDVLESLGFMAAAFQSV
jgi:hypothetical protein